VSDSRTDLLAGEVQKTFFVPALKFTALPALLDEMIVVRLRVVPLAVYVPIPTSHSAAAVFEMV
jgi:hypothetical protein